MDKKCCIKINIESSPQEILIEICFLEIRIPITGEIIYLAVIGRLRPGIGLGWFISGALEEGSDGLGVLLGDPLDILPISYKKYRYLIIKDI